MAVVEKAGSDGYLLVENHCPICTAAAACTGICAAELAVFRAVLGAEVTVDGMGNIIYALPGGETVTAPGPGVEIVDITENPAAFASTPSELVHVIEAVINGEDTTNDGEPTVAAIIVSNGLSQGPDAFSMRILNSGKPASK